jgi:hypothetical protein
MKNRKTWAVVVILLITCLFGGTGQAQRRRTQKRAPVPRTRFAPLTTEQKAAVAGILKKAYDLEITYSYAPLRYAEDAYNLSIECGEVQDTLPDGTMQYMLLDMWGAWRAASIMYGVCLPSRKSSWHGYLDLDKKVPEIVREYKLQGMSPCQAQRGLFNYARILNMRARAVLDSSPTKETE